MSAILRNSTLKDLPLEINKDKEELNQIKLKDTVKTLSHEYMEKGVSCVPVYDKDSGAYVGLIDSFDLVNFYLTTPEAPADVEQITVDQVLSVWTPKSRRLNIFDVTDDLETLLRSLAFRGHQALVTQHDRLNNKSKYEVVNQQDILRLIYNSQAFEVSNKKVEELNLVNPLGSTVITINTESTAYDGFKRMINTQHSGIGVIDSQGILVAVLSASDMKGFTKEVLESLQLPVLEFLEKVSNQKPCVPVTCFASSTLEDVTLKALTASVQRIFVTNSTGQLIGVITLSDIIQTLLGIPQLKMFQMENKALDPQ